MLIRFLAVYDDGSKEPFDIDNRDLRRGDHVARVIARQRQRAEYPRLKPGEIVKVYRDPAIGYLDAKRAGGVS
jgi:hypothetical protein